MRGGADGRCRGHEHAFPPPSLHVSALLEILDDARDRVRVDAEEAGQLPNAGQGLVARDAASLDGVLELLRQLRSEEHTSELQSRPHLVCRLLLEKKNKFTPRISCSLL